MGKGTDIRITEQEFIERYSGYAMQLQQMYGIPSSVILAQMSIESDWGNSGHAKDGKNFFGMKAGATWKGPVRYAWDDEDKKSPFRVYATWQDSMNDYARLMMTKRYNWCCKYDSTDHENWIKGIKSNGYCTDNNYVTKIESRIKRFGLDRFDRQAVSDAQAKGIAVGYMRGTTPTVNPGNTAAKDGEATNQVRIVAEAGKRYAFPVDGDIVVNSGFGPRNKPNAKASSDHKGIDINVNMKPVYATEDKGHVESVNHNADLNSGKSIKVRYSRMDGTSYIVTYMHLHEINVNAGDSVSAGQKIGVSGNTGNTTGPHLHFEVAEVSANGKSKVVDPNKYLAEIAVRGGIDKNVTLRGSDKDMLAAYKSEMYLEKPQERDLELLTEEQRNLLAQQYMQAQSRNEKDYISQLMAQSQGSHSNDMLSEIVSLAFTAVISLAIQLEHGQFDEDVVKGELAIEENSQYTRQYVVDRSQDVNPKHATQVSSLAFDSEYPENHQTTGVRLA